MELKSVPFEAKVDAENRIVEGYASTWDLDEVDDVIERGAFAKTIAERAGLIKVLWQHFDPLGKPEHMEEDTTGLFTRSRISKTTLGDDALQLMADGVVDRMSIGFTIPRGKADIETDPETGNEVRRIREVKLFEYSPVTFAANEAAVITGVKQLQDFAMREGRSLSKSTRSQIEQSIENLKALLEGRQPDPRGTTGSSDEPPNDADTDPELKQLLQSMSAESESFAVRAALLNMR